MASSSLGGHLGDRLVSVLGNFGVGRDAHQRGVVIDGPDHLTAFAMWSAGALTVEAAVRYGFSSEG